MTIDPRTSLLDLLRDQGADQRQAGLRRGRVRGLHRAGGRRGRECLHLSGGLGGRQAHPHRGRRGQNGRPLPGPAGLRGRRGGAVRLLHSWADHDQHRLCGIAAAAGRSATSRTTSAAAMPATSAAARATTPSSRPCANPSTRLRIPKKRLDPRHPGRTLPARFPARGLVGPAARPA
jgi:hypothetical protein